MEGEASYAYAANPATRDFNIAMLEFQGIAVMLNVFFESKPPPTRASGMNTEKPIIINMLFRDLYSVDTCPSRAASFRGISTAVRISRGSYITKPPGDFVPLPSSGADDGKLNPTRHEGGWGGLILTMIITSCGGVLPGRPAPAGRVFPWRVPAQKQPPGTPVPRLHRSCRCPYRRGRTRPCSGW